MNRKTVVGLTALGAVLGIATAAGIVTAKKKKQKRLPCEDKKILPPKRNIYFAGGGLAALTGAYYLIHDCKIPGECIHIFEASGSIGGAFNVGGDEETGYVCTSPKLLSLRNHTDMMDMLKGIPSVNLPDISVKDEITNFMKLNPIKENARLINDNMPVNHGFGVSKAAIKSIKELLSAKDSIICDIAIEDYFIDTPDFFTSNLWLIISSSFMLSRTASAVELKHILNCISGDINGLFTLSGAVRSQFNLQETVIDALVKYLVARNVNFATHCRVNDVDFEDDSCRISAIHLEDNGTAKTFYLNRNDLCVITNGSVSECATIGDYNSPAPASDEKPISATLWRNMTKKQNGLGNPDAFFTNANSELVSFTITAKSPKLVECIEEFTQNSDSYGVLTTFGDSPWGLTVSTVVQPHFSSQTDYSYVICGYGVNVNKEGKYIDKTMKDSSGAEILFELVKFLKLEHDWDEITKDIVNVIPCLMPYATASSLPYNDTDKPYAVPDKNSNFAFIGQFARLDGGIISYSSEYAVRTAREAVYRLTKKSSAPSRKSVMTSRIKLFNALKK